MYNHEELILAFKQNDAKLPLLDKSSTSFVDIFDCCLRFNSDERFADVFEFITKLDEIQRVGDGEKTIPEPNFSHLNMEAKKNFKNASITEKLPEKIYFTRDHFKNTDPQKRSENAITAENLWKLQQNDSSFASVSVDLEAHMAPANQQPGIFSNESILDKIRKSVENQRVTAPKKPFRQTHESPDTLEASRRSLTDSTLYQSFFDFNRLHTPKVDKDVIYGRTSTLKKRMKNSEAQLPKKSIKGLFENHPASSMNDVFNKMDVELNKIVQDYNKKDFLNEIFQELEEHKKLENPNSLLNRGMADQSQSFEELQTKTDVPLIKRSESDHLGTSYGFSLGDYTLPKTPIARQNKIRRNAWLSDSKKPSGGRISNAILKLNKSGNDLKLSNNSPGNASGKQYNVSIEIHHNDLDKTSKQHKKSNNDSSINIEVSSAEAGSLLIAKPNNELNHSRYNIDINKKYYPMMPEMLSDVIQNKRDRSGFLPQNDKNDSDAEVEVLSGKDENVIAPVRTSVRDAVKFIESTFKPEIQELASPGRRQSSAALRDDVPALQRPNDDFQSNQAQELSVIENSQPVSLDKCLETFNYTTPKKITTKVTVNMKKVSRHASDVDHSEIFQDQGRHSVCNNAELVKRIQMHFKARDSSLQFKQKQSATSASCGSLIPKDNTEEQYQVQHQGKCAKYFCRNCGFTMPPAEVLQKIQSTRRISIASNLAEGLQSIQHDGSSQSMAALMKCQPISVRYLLKKSYEGNNMNYFRKLNQLRIFT